MKTALMSTFTNHFFHYYTGRSFHRHVLTVFILSALLNVTSAALQLGRSDANATDPPPVQDFDWGTVSIISTIGLRGSRL